jgi:hypothetical protein
MEHRSGDRLFIDMIKNLSYGLPALLMAVVIFYMSSFEKIGLPLMAIPCSDLLFHAVAYFLFGLTLMLAAYPWNASLDYPLRVYITLGLIGALYGLSDEIHQSFIPNRTCTISDFLADSFGVILALLSARWWAKRRIAHGN